MFSNEKWTGKGAEMENPYNLHFYCEYLRQDALCEARKRHLMDHARAGRKQRPGQSSLGLLLRRIPLRGARLAG
jgi:hypothetical protein